LMATTGDHNLAVDTPMDAASALQASARLSLACGLWLGAGHLTSCVEQPAAGPR